MTLGGTARQGSRGTRTAGHDLLFVSRDRGKRVQASAGSTKVWSTSTPPSRTFHEYDPILLSPFPRDLRNVRVHIPIFAGLHHSPPPPPPLQIRRHKVFPPSSSNIEPAAKQTTSASQTGSLGGRVDYSAKRRDVSVLFTVGVRTPELQKRETRARRTQLLLGAELGRVTAAALAAVGGAGRETGVALAADHLGAKKELSFEHSEAGRARQGRTLSQL
jgi:hypothetical protein